MSFKAFYNKHGLKISSWYFIISGFAVTFLGFLSFIYSGANMYLRGFSDAYFSVGVSILDIVNGLFLFVGGIFALRKTRLQLCYNIGVMIAAFAVIQLVMGVGPILMEGQVSLPFIIYSLVSIIFPIIYVTQINHLQNQKADEKLADENTETNSTIE